MRTLGCLCYATKPNFSDKFTPKSTLTIVIGYSSTQKGYRLYDIDSSKFFVSRDVVFKEHVFPFKYPKRQFLIAPYLTSSPSTYFLSTVSSSPSTQPTSPPTSPSEISHESSSFDYFADPSVNIPQNPTDPAISSTSVRVNINHSSPSPLRRSGKTTKPYVWLTDYVHLPLPSTSNCTNYLIQYFVSYAHLPPHF